VDGDAAEGATVVCAVAVCDARAGVDCCVGKRGAHRGDCKTSGQTRKGFHRMRCFWIRLLLIRRENIGKSTFLNSPTNVWLPRTNADDGGNLEEKATGVSATEELVADRSGRRLSNPFNLQPGAGGVQLNAHRNLLRKADQRRS